MKMDKRITHLIEHALTDGVITPVELKVIYLKAEELGITKDQVDAAILDISFNKSGDSGKSERQPELISAVGNESASKKKHKKKKSKNDSSNTNNELEGCREPYTELKTILVSIVGLFGLTVFFNRFKNFGCNNDFGCDHDFGCDNIGCDHDFGCDNFGCDGFGCD